MEYLSVLFVVLFHPIPPLFFPVAKLVRSYLQAVIVEDFCSHTIYPCLRNWALCQFCAYSTNRCSSCRCSNVFVGVAAIRALSCSALRWYGSALAQPANDIAMSVKISFISFAPCLLVYVYIIAPIYSSVNRPKYRL